MKTPRPLTTGPITTIESLRDHLYQAAQVELSTIPLYLYAGYSIRAQSYSQWSPGQSAFRAIRAVVIEEMLHLSLARNLLVAVGGGDRIAFYDKAFVPTYPTPMLHRVPPLELRLSACSPALMHDVFMPLERPMTADGPPQPDQYNTLGQFYEAIRLGFETLAGPDLFANPQTDLQFAAGYYNQDGGGQPVVVSDLVTALEAIDTIVVQGEGTSPGRLQVPLDPAAPQLGLDEQSHYARFKAIAEGIDGIGAVWPVPDNPKATQYPAPVADLARLFNAGYCYLLAMVDALYATPADERHASARWQLERSYLTAMQGVLFPIADLLVRQAVPGGHAAPTFEFFAFRAGRPKQDQMLDLCDKVARSYPSVAGDNSVRASIVLLPSV
ncbi:MAG: ferritin-like domain-containing protein [Acidimicrobiia bacterium]